MTPGQQQVLLFVGNAGGRIATTAACFATHEADAGLCVAEGYLREADGYYLMGTAGENALAASLAPAA